MIFSFKSKEDFNYGQAVEMLSNFIYNNEVIIVCIGTDRSTGDSLGPLVGTKLKERNSDLKVYGTLESPIHANNLKDKVNAIREVHPNAKILSIDASLSKNVEDISLITLKDKGFKPGAALGKDLGTVGDISITGVVNITSDFQFMILQNTRLYVVYSIAESIKNFILDAKKLSNKLEGEKEDVSL